MMSKTGRPRQSIMMSPLDHVEAFYCLQVERIQQNFQRRYGFDYYKPHTDKTGRTVAENRYHVMPQNDHMTKLQIQRDCDIKVMK